MQKREKKICKPVCSETREAVRIMPTSATTVSKALGLAHNVHLRREQRVAAGRIGSHFMCWSSQQKV